MTGVITTVGASHATHIGSVVTFVTSTAVTVAIVPANILVRWRAIRCLPVALRFFKAMKSLIPKPQAIKLKTMRVTHCEFPCLSNMKENAAMPTPDSSIVITAIQS